MKLFCSILLTRLLLLQTVFAQQPVVSKVRFIAYQNQLAAGPAFPLAWFSETHLPGITASYMRKMDRIKTIAPPVRKKTGWLTGASLSWFAGKKEKAGNNTFRYYGYSLLDLQGGMGWYPEKKLSFSLRTGPGLSYYKKNFRFIVTGHLQGSYAIGSKTNITPGLSFIKETGSDALWISSLQVGFIF